MEEQFKLSTWELTIMAMAEVSSYVVIAPGGLVGKMDLVEKLVDFLRDDTDKKMQIWSLTQADTDGEQGFNTRLAQAAALYEAATKFVEAA